MNAMLSWEEASPVDLREVITVALVFIPLQIALPNRRGQKIFRKQWVSDVAYLLFNGLFIRAGMAVLFGLMLVRLQTLVPTSLTSWVGKQSLWLQVPAAFVLSDVGYYVSHRMFHRVPFLWRFHAVHHSIEELDWLAAHRVHPVDQIVTMVLSLTPVLLLGFSLPAMAIFGFIHLMQAHLVHANVKIPFGPLRWVFCSPQFHHWHHANQDGAYDKNFSARMIWLDWIGGTLYLPKDASHPEKYGTDDPVPLVYPLQLVWPLTRQARRWRAEAAASPELAVAPDTET